MVLGNNIRGDCGSYTMVPPPSYYNISCGSDVPLYRESRIEIFIKRPPHTYTIVITAQIESGFVAEDDLIRLQSNLLEHESTPNGDDGEWVNGSTSDRHLETDTETRRKCCMYLDGG
ncbi:hypothetical protein TNCV_549381 [Trichonephila clavipes]|nr:hypothetical protein TNCV_549381 [Trichonephila clavipes]